MAWHGMAWHDNNYPKRRTPNIESHSEVWRPRHTHTHTQKETYDPVKTGAMAVEAVDAMAFPNLGVMVVNAEALAERRAAARKNFILNTVICFLFFLVWKMK